MNLNKPSIFVYVRNANRDIVKEVCAGIEEEGVLYTVLEMEGSLDELAYQAANDSALSVGIGILEGDIAIQARLLTLGENLFSYRKASKEVSRIAGANSARVIKRIPFKLGF